MKCPRCGKDNPAEIHTCSPLALVLADEMIAPLGTMTSYQAAQQAAAELRRLHAENEALVVKNAELTENLEKKSVAIQRIWKERDELRSENEALRQLTADLLSALEYHEEQTRPIHSTTIAIEAARAALARAGEVK